MNNNSNSESMTVRTHGRKAHGKKRKPLFAVLLAIILLIFGLFAFKSISKGKDWTVAVFGVDSRDGNLEKHTRSDVIMVVNVNQRTGMVKLVSVYRDSYLSTGDGHYNKINAAYEKGGHKQAVKALEENLDIHIDDYVTFGWSAVAKGINALGGIDLELSDAEFSIINAFITETVESTGIGSVHLEHAGMNHLDGVQAVAYGRLRLIDTDFNRTARQRKVISLALDKAKNADTKMLVSAATSLISEVSTSIGIDDIIPIIRTLDKYQLTEDSQAGFPFSRKTQNIGKLDCVVPTTLYSNVIILHEFLYGTENYKPSSTVKKISDKIASDSGLTEEGEIAPPAKTGGGKVYKPKAPKPADTPVADPETSEAEATFEETLSNETLSDNELSEDILSEEGPSENESSDDEFLNNDLGNNIHGNNISDNELSESTISDSEESSSENILGPGDFIDKTTSPESSDNVNISNEPNPSPSSSDAAEHAGDKGDFITIG